MNEDAEIRLVHISNINVTCHRTEFLHKSLIELV